MDNSQQFQQQMPDAMQSQTSPRCTIDELFNIIHPKPSKAQDNMEPTIEKVYAEAKTMRDSGTVPNWENMNALGASLDAVDIDSFNPRINRDREVLDRTRPAKLRAVEMLYEFAKDMSKRELVSVLRYVASVMGEMEVHLLGGDMGEGYWTEAWLERESFLLRARGGYSSDDGYDEEDDDEYDLKSDTATYKSPHIKSEPENVGATSDTLGAETEHDLMDESMKE